MTSAHRSLGKNIAACALALAAGGACAQSSLVVFGTADSAVRRASTDRSGSITSLVSGSYASSRFGFRGQEDLGKGWAASFWLESFLNVDTGVQNPAGFQRRSTLSLTSRDFGELRLGRDYTPTHSNWARFDPFGYVGIGSNQLLILSATGQTPVTAAFGSNPNDVQRANNGVAYFLPRNPWDVEGSLVRNLGEGGTAANDQHRAVGGRLGVTFGPVFVSGARLETTNNLTGGNKFKDSAFGAMLSVPFIRLSAAIRRHEYLTSRQDTTMLAGLLPFAGVQEFKFSWVRAKMNGRVGTTDIGQNRSDQYALGYVYHLSKRSRLYATVATLHNDGNARFVLPGAPAATAGGLSSRGVESGINHEF